MSNINNVKNKAQYKKSQTFEGSHLKESLQGGNMFNPNNMIKKFFGENNKNIIPPKEVFMLKKYKVALLAIVFATVLPQISSGLIIELSMPNLVKTSDLIVRGSIVKTESYWGSLSWDPNSRIILTSATLQISESYKGVSDKSEIIIETEGGEIGEIGLFVEDMPKFAPNQDVIVFLSAQDSKGIRRVVNLYNGKYSLSEGKVLERNETINQFVNKIKQTVKQTRGGLR